MLAKILTGSGLVSAGLLLILLTTTTPSSAGAFGILCIFILGYTAILALMTFTLWITGRLVSRLGRATHRRNSYNISLKKSYYFSTILALGPIIMISLQSVGGVGVYEVLLIVLFTILGCIYVYRRSA